MGFQSLFILVAGLASGLLLGILFAYLGMRLFNFATLDVAAASVYISMNSIRNALLVGTITVIVSSIIPVWMAGRISPIEAMRRTASTGKRQKIRAYQGMIKKLTGISGEMAYKNVWRNKWTTLIIVVSLALGGGLFMMYISFFIDENSIMSRIDPKMLPMQDNDFKLSFGANTDPDFTGYTNKDLQAIAGINGVKEIGTKIDAEGFLESNAADLHDYFKKYNGLSSSRKTVESTIEVKGYDDKQLHVFRQYVDQGNIAALNDSPGEYPQAAVFNYFYDILQNNRLEEIRKNLRVGDLLTIRIPVVKHEKLTYEEHVVRVAALLKPEWTLKGDSTRRYMEVMLPQRYLMAASGENSYDLISVQCEPGRDAYVYKQINRILKNKPFQSIESKQSYVEENRKGFTTKLKSQMIIVALILLIAGMNVFNTIKADLLIRTNEFSMLRAIGMTAKQLKSMIIREAVLYGIIGSILGALIGSYTVYKFYNLVNSQNKDMNIIIQFKLPIIPILLYSAVVIAICALSAYASARREGKLNIVEGLRATE
jgi:putative ABC transport system permease protein